MLPHLARSSEMIHAPASYFSPQVRQTLAVSCLPSMMEIQNNLCQHCSVSFSVWTGPVGSSLSLFLIEKVMKRLVAGQILRKGILRKMRRLASILGTWHVFQLILEELLENLQ